MTDTLDRIIYSKPTAVDHSNKATDLVAYSGNLSPEDSAPWRELVTLQPLPSTERTSPAVGIFNGPGKNFLLTIAFHESDRFMFESTLIPRKLLQQAAGNVEPLIKQAIEAAPAAPLSADQKLVPVEVPVLLPWSTEERLQHLRASLREVDGGIDTVLRLLAAALSEPRLMIKGAPEDQNRRLALVQGLMALLPAPARADFTFATSVTHTDSPATQVIFVDGEQSSDRHTADLSTGAWPDETLMTMPYIALLKEMWQDDEVAFIDALEELEPLANVLLPGNDLLTGLDKLATQLRLNQQVRQGETLPPETLKEVLSSDLPLPPDLNRQYNELLLEHALDERDTEAALLVAMHMDEDAELDKALGAVLTANLETQPDDVYVFVRTRLNDAMEIDPRWIEHLRAAALVSLQVAISDADSDTIMSWLRLIAREPAAYGLADILRDGILATQERAHSDGDLARYLVTLTIKHASDILDTLLNDEALLEALPNNMGLVLREHAGDPLYTLQQRGPEVFMVAMARSARARATSVFTTDVIDQIWKIYAAGQSCNVPDAYQPDSVIEIFLTTGAEWLPGEILTHLATLMLADGRDDVFTRLAAHLADHDALTGLLSTTLQNSQRSIDDIMAIVNQLAAAGHLEQQDVVDVAIELLELREWRQSALPLVEHLARMAHQQPSLEIPQEMVWRLLDMAMAARSDMVARVGAQRIFSEIEQQAQVNGKNGDADALMIETLTRLHDSLQWSQQARHHLLKWWRDFVHKQPLTRLTRLDKALENKKSLADCRAIIQTSLAFRRMLGNRSMTEFAEAVNTVYSILEDLSESFDPSSKQPATFDEETVRSELDARREELTDHEWRILAKNFKELAGLIGLMGDHRSRGNLVRQNVDRQLLAGAQQPESAVDAMKWMAGYLDGVQERTSDGDE